MSGETDLKQTIERVVNHYPLSEAEAEQVMGRIMEGEATPAQIAALLTALRLEGGDGGGDHRVCPGDAGEDEPDHAAVQTLVDIVGTGGDRRFTFNISTTAAFVAAGAGLPVAKHGNRSVSSRCGSADVLEAPGRERDVGPGGGGALPGGDRDRLPVRPGVPRRHEARRRPPAGDRHPHRLQPAGAADQPGGRPGAGAGGLRPQPDRGDRLRSAQARDQRAMVVHGSDGLDEITHTGRTRISELNGDQIRTYYLEPVILGIRQGSLEEIVGGGAEDNARITRDVLAGCPGPCRDVVLMNAAAALLVGGKVDTMRDGVRLAAEVIDSGAAMAKLDSLVAFTRSAEGAVKREMGASNVFRSNYAG